MQDPVEEEEKKEVLESTRNEMAIATTALFFLLFLAPVGFGIFGFPINLYLGVSVGIHEVGHLIFGFSGSRILAVAGGTLFEYLNPVLAVVIFARDRRGTALAMIFLACIGSVMPATASYMESASNPYGTSYFGAITGRQGDVGPENHDWHIMFSEWGLLGSEHRIAGYVRGIGEALVLVGTIASVFGFWFLLNYNPAGFSELALIGGVPAAAYFAWTGSLPQLAVCIAFILAALLWIGINKWRIKRQYRIPEKGASSS